MIKRLLKYPLERALVTVGNVLKEQPGDLRAVNWSVAGSRAAGPERPRVVVQAMARMRAEQWDGQGEAVALVHVRNKYVVEVHLLVSASDTSAEGEEAMGEELYARVEEMWLAGAVSAAFEAETQLKIESVVVMPEDVGDDPELETGRRVILRWEVTVHGAVTRQAVVAAVD